MEATTATTVIDDARVGARERGPQLDVVPGDAKDWRGCRKSCVTQPPSNCMRHLKGPGETIRQVLRKTDRLSPRRRGQAQRDQSSCRPHGAKVASDGTFFFKSAAPNGGSVMTSLEILPIPHEILRQAASDDGTNMQGALKISVEREQPECITAYLPTRKKMWGEFTRKGEVVQTKPDPEIVPEWFEEL